jgi:uncharacterized protein with HEPN domain
MKPEHLYMDYLRDILDNAKKASDFMKGMTEDDFFQWLSRSLKIKLQRNNQ